MDNHLILEGIAKAAWLITGSIGILGVFTILCGGLIWLWLQAGKWLCKYIRKVRGEFAEALQGVVNTKKSGGNG